MTSKAATMLTLQTLLEHLSCPLVAGRRRAPVGWGTVGWGAVRWGAIGGCSMLLQEGGCLQIEVHLGIGDLPSWCQLDGGSCRQPCGCCVRAHSCCYSHEDNHHIAMDTHVIFIQLSSHQPWRPASSHVTQAAGTSMMALSKKLGLVSSRLTCA